jgi:DNA helicase HerA-like ATPase
MQFLFNPGSWAVKPDGTTLADLDALFEEWIGADAPISVFDLSGIPSAVVDDLVGAVLRILYDAVFWGRLKKEGGRERPLLIVLEEAHVYLGTQSKGRAASATRRIAKEGRKYGVGLMLVSQRPSEIDPTILSQCGTIAALRLTNDADRTQVTSCASDNLKGLFSMLPILRTGEALIVGEAVNMPIRAIIDRPPEGRRPDSEDPMAVVPKGPGGKRIHNGGWTEPVENENYKPLVEAWRKQDPNAGSVLNKLSSSAENKE